MSENENKSDSGFKVVDRRSFFKDGTPRQENEEETPSPQESPKQPETTQRDKDLYGIDFPSFILQLASTVQLQLGMIPHPATGKPEPDIARAQGTINLMKLLKHKTRGNLGEKEGKVVDQMIQDCEMHFNHLNQALQNETIDPKND